MLLHSRWADSEESKMWTKAERSLQPHPTVPDRPDQVICRPDWDTDIKYEYAKMLPWLSKRSGWQLR